VKTILPGMQLQAMIALLLLQPRVQLTFCLTCCLRPAVCYISGCRSIHAADGSNRPCGFPTPTHLETNGLLCILCTFVHLTCLPLALLGLMIELLTIALAVKLNMLQA